MRPKPWPFWPSLTAARRRLPWPVPCWGGILSALPETQVQVQKTQITLKHRHVFAALSLPRRSRDRKDHKLTLTLGLAHRLDSPRVDIATEPYPGRWTHHLPVSTPEDLDGQLLAWLQEAYDFAQSKR